MKAESITYWFFRLNGCLTTINFIIHPDMKGPQRTDVDILAVRFPYHKELNMIDHNIFIKEKDRISIFITEVKQGKCNLNGPWVDKNRKNIHRVLKSIGAFHPDIIEKVAESLYNQTRYEDGLFVVQLVAVGRETNDELKEKYKLLIQLTYEKDILPFIYHRFKEYGKQKRDHTQWDDVGKQLYEYALKKNENDFISCLLEFKREEMKIV